MPPRKHRMTSRFLPMPKMNPWKMIGTAFALACHAAALAIEPGGTAPDCQVVPIGGGPSQDLHHYRGRVVYREFHPAW